MIGQYWHTLRHLRPIQYWGRVWHRFYRPLPENKSAPALRQAHSTAGWHGCDRAPSMLGPSTFRFLNQEAGLAGPADWQRQDLPLLWRYHLHYFDDLNAADAPARRDWHQALIQRWITENPPAQGSGWDPYPLSLRSVNWIKWQLAGNTLDEAAIHSLAMQVRHLRKHLEFHLLGNHLWANAKALVFAGCCFEGREARLWLKAGLVLLQKELREQVLPDGGHFERSPMYHAIVLEDVLDLLQLSAFYPGLLPGTLIDSLENTAAAMLYWLDAMTHPDGGIAFFNDATHEVAPRFQDLYRYALSFDLSLMPLLPPALMNPLYLSHSGYVVLRLPGICLMADVAPIGPDYQPGHAHADTLSFELSLYGQRMIVNSGIDRYGCDAERLRQRGTAAHSTVTVDGADSSEVWSGFRVARRARPHGVSVGTEWQNQQISAWHDGYRRLPGRVSHQRQWEAAFGRLLVTDCMNGRFGEALARFYLHPAVTVEEVTARTCRLMANEVAVACEVIGGSLWVEDTEYFPAFGVRQANRCLVVKLEGERCETLFTW